MCRQRGTHSSDAWDENHRPRGRVREDGPQGGRESDLEFCELALASCVSATSLRLPAQPTVRCGPLPRAVTKQADPTMKTMHTRSTGRRLQAWRPAGGRSAPLSSSSPGSLARWGRASGWRKKHLPISPKPHTTLSMRRSSASAEIAACPTAAGYESRKRKYTTDRGTKASDASWQRIERRESRAIGLCSQAGSHRTNLRRRSRPCAAPSRGHLRSEGFRYAFPTSCFPLSSTPWRLRHDCVVGHDRLQHMPSLPPKTSRDCSFKCMWPRSRLESTSIRAS